jgi:hypothetical protein
MAGPDKIIDVRSHPILPYGQGAPVGPGQKQPAGLSKAHSRIWISTFNKADLQSLSYGNAGRLYPSLKARIEQACAHNGSGSALRAEGIQLLRRGST